MKIKSINHVLILLVMILSSSIVLAQDSLMDVLPPDIHPVVILQGNNYEMGYQYGLQVGHMIERRRDKKLAELVESATPEYIEEGVKAIQFYIKKYAPECIDIIRGMADGARAAGNDVSYEDVLLLNCRLPKMGVADFPKEAKDEDLEKGCSICSAWGSSTKDGRLIGMDCHDIGDALYQLMVVAFPEEGNPYMCGSSAGEVGNHFLMNNKGVFFGNSGGGGSPRNEDFGYGISWSCSLPHIARYANNANEAKDMIMNMKINIPENFHFVDTKGNAYVIEKTTAIQAVRKPGDFGERNFLFSTNNVLIDKMKVTKETDQFTGNHGGYGTITAPPRNQLLWDMLHNYRGNIDIDFIKMILRFPGNGPPYPPEGGWETKVLRPSNSRVAVIVPDDGNKGYAYICTGPAGRYIPATIDPRGRYAIDKYINGTKTFYKLTLASEPKMVCKAAMKDAVEVIAKSHQSFMKLDYSYPGYAELKRMYNEANTEFYRGQNCLNRAILSTGREAVLLFSKATTQFTRAQAHAMQIYEALNPPPKNPQDLGLKPFGGGWGVWETKFK